MANIVLCRIDSRLIHGQVVTKWVGQSQANRIAVVSDELDADPFMKNIYLMAAPPNIKVDCFGNQSFAAAWKENRHCCKVSDEAAFCLIQRPYISKTLLTRRISPRGSP